MLVAGDAVRRFPGAIRAAERGFRPGRGGRGPRRDGERRRPALHRSDQRVSSPGGSPRSRPRDGYHAAQAPEGRLVESASIDAYAAAGAASDARTGSAHAHFAATRGGNGVAFAENEIPYHEVGCGITVMADGAVWVASDFR